MDIYISFSSIMINVFNLKHVSQILNNSDGNVLGHVKHQCIKLCKKKEVIRLKESYKKLS